MKSRPAVAGADRELEMKTYLYALASVAVLAAAAAPASAEGFRAEIHGGWDHVRANDAACIHAKRDLAAAVRLGYKVGERGTLYALAGYSNARFRFDYTTPA